MTDNDDEIARARAAKKGTPFLNTEQAAAYLGLSPRKLQYMRRQGEGPSFRRHGRYVRYHIDDVIGWSRGTATLEATAAGVTILGATMPGATLAGNFVAARDQGHA